MCALARFTTGSKTEVSLKEGLQRSTYCIPVGYPHVTPGDRRHGGTRACGRIAGGGCVSGETAADICWNRINRGSAFQRGLEETHLGFAG